jgi:hypothetical protein
VVIMAVVVLGVKIQGHSLAFPWYVPIGVAITLLVGGGLSLTHPREQRVFTGTSSDDAAGQRRAAEPQ